MLKNQLFLQHYSKNSRKEGIEPTQVQIDYEKFLQIEKDNDPIKEFYEGCSKKGWIAWLILGIVLLAGPLYLICFTVSLNDISDNLEIFISGYKISVAIISLILVIITIIGTSIGSMWPIN